MTRIEDLEDRLRVFQVNQNSMKLDLDKLEDQVGRLQEMRGQFVQLAILTKQLAEELRELTRIFTQWARDQKEE